MVAEVGRNLPARSVSLFTSRSSTWDAIAIVSDVPSLWFSASSIIGQVRYSKDFWGVRNPRREEWPGVGYENRLVRTGSEDTYIPPLRALRWEHLVRHPYITSPETGVDERMTTELRIMGSL